MIKWLPCRFQQCLPLAVNMLRSNRKISPLSNRKVFQPYSSEIDEKWDKIAAVKTSADSH